MFAKGDGRHIQWKEWWFHTFFWICTYIECHARVCVVIKVKTVNFGRIVPSALLRRVRPNEWKAIFPPTPEGDVGLRNILEWGGELSSALRFDSSVSSIQSHSSVSAMGANSSNVSSLFLLTCVERCRIANPALFNPANNGHVALHYRRYCGAQSITFRN